MKTKEKKINNTKWSIVKLREVCDKESSNISMKQIKYEEGNYPIYGAKGFIKNISFYQQNKEYISIIKDGSGVGRLNIRKAFSSVIGTLQYILPKTNIYIQYLYYYLLGVDFTKYIQGAAIPHIYFKDYCNEVIPLPPLQEQKAIVKVLDKAFELIDKAKANLEKNLVNTKELFQAKLKQIFSQKEKHWQRKTLGEVAELVRGVTYSKKDEVDNDGYSILRANNIIIDCSLNLNDIKYIRKSLRLKDKQKLKENDIFICLASGSKSHIGKVAFIDNDINHYFGGFMGSIRTKNIYSKLSKL